MPLPLQVRDRVRALLGAGETLRYCFPARLTGAGRIIIAVTDEAVVLLKLGPGRRLRPKAVLGRYPRSTRLGPVDTGLITSFTLDGRIYELDDEYIPVVNAADAELSPHTLPQDPLPDL